MRNLAFFSVGILLILVQANWFRVLVPLGELVAGMAGLLGFAISPGWIHGFTPDLILPLVVFLGVQEPSTARGALLAFGLGYALDILAAAPTWLFRFVCVVIWWLARVAGVRLAAQTTLTRIPLAFAFAVVQSGIILILLAIFGSDTRRPLEIGTIVVPHAIATALVAPFVFKLAQRLNLASLPPQAGEAPSG